ncbi:GNAT family N-acetyltransferase [Providencia rettgeri]|nr:GNAT family N-acetyltransferase [Providencia sp. PROV130]
MRLKHSMYQIEKLPPSAQEYCDLRIKAGLSMKSLSAAKIGLPNSLFAVSIRDGETLIAMGRVVGDGACNFEIVDIAVDPNWQGKGLGRVVMEHIESYLNSAVLEGSYVSMIADKPEFYQKMGYLSVGPKSEGMTKKFNTN